MKLHLQTGEKTACGRRPQRATEDRTAVDCGNCKRTRTYRAAPAAAVPAPAVYRLTKPVLEPPAPPVRTPQPETDPAAIAADRAAYWHALYRSAVSETEKLRAEMAEMQRAVRVEAIVGQRGRVFPGLWR